MGTTRSNAARGGSGFRPAASRSGPEGQELLAFAQGAGNQAFGALLGRQVLARQEDGGWESSGDGGGGGGGYEPSGGGAPPAADSAPTHPPATWETTGDGASSGGTGYEEAPKETRSEITPTPESQLSNAQPGSDQAQGEDLERAAVEVYGHVKKSEEAARQAEAAGHPHVAAALRETAESLRAHAGNLASGNGAGDLQRLARETDAKANEAQRTGAPPELVYSLRQTASQARQVAGVAASVALKQRGGGPPAIN